jgi:DNA-binding transcriptional MerR regulator
VGEYESRDIEERTGVSRRNVQFLVDVGVIEPKERGRGKPIKYTERNLIEVAMTQTLQERNQTVSTIRGIFHHLREVTREGEYTDFFTNDAWGVTKDLIYAEATVGGGEGSLPTASGGTQRITREVGMDYQLPKEVMEDVVRPAISPIIIVPLGKIKNLALERLKTRP